MSRVVRLGLKVVWVIAAVLLAALVAGRLFINSIARTASSASRSRMPPAALT